VIGRRLASPPHHPQQRVIADRRHQTFGEPGGWPAAKREAEMMNNAFRPRSAPGALGNNVMLEPFGEDLPSAERRLAEKAPGLERPVTGSRCPLRTG
jgi:hypothetical protein